MPNLRTSMLRSALISSVVAGIMIAPIVQLSLVAPASAQFTRFLSFWQRRPPLPLGTRSGVCPMTPGLLDKDLTIVSDRPLFSWQGKAAKLNVRDYKTKEIIWSTDLDAQTQQVVYGDATPLEPGKIYQWQVLGQDTSSTDRAHWSTVAVMAAPDRDAVTAKLKDIEQKGRQNQQSPEEIVDQQAMYLIDQNLWSDALQVLYAVKNPSSEFVQKRQQFSDSLCTFTATSMTLAK